MLGVARKGLGPLVALQLGALAALGCGQVSRDGGGDASPAGGSASGSDGPGGSPTAGGAAGGATAGSAAEDPVSCDAEGNQVERDAQGVALATGRVCTVKVMVDDETSIPCATKADGSYRCWADEGATPLPPADYVQVQQGTQGFVALTRDGRIVAPDMQPSHIIAPVIELTSTNMGGARSLCYRTEPAGPLTMWYPAFDPSIPREGESLREHAGPFAQGLCVYEGLAYGLRPNGKIWGIASNEDYGDGYVQIAANFHFICGVKADGSLACANGWSPLAPNCVDGYPQPECADPLATPSPPVFPPGRYTQVATTWLTACALTTSRELVCVRGDGELLPGLPGRYSSVAAGRSVMCAIRVEGTTTCWEHVMGQPLTTLKSFDVYRYALDADW